MLLAACLLAIAVGVLVVSLPRSGPASDQLAGSRTPASNPVDAQTVARNKAIAWILQQVDRAALVSCDPQVCRALVRAGFPSGNVSQLGPASNDPLGSALVVVTTPVRAQYRSRLASVYAPAIIASFGSGANRIDIRLVYPGGAAGYDAVRQTDLRHRKAVGAELLANSHIKASAAARAQLLSGDVDPRLPELLAYMADRHPVRITDFVDQSPGGGPASLLRSVDLATVVSAAQMTRAAYVGWMYALIGQQQAEYRPASWQTAHAACWRVRAEDRVRRAEPAQLAGVRAWSARTGPDASRCAAGAPSRSPPSRREDAADLQRVDLGKVRKKQEDNSCIRHFR